MILYMLHTRCIIRIVDGSLVIPDHPESCSDRWSVVVIGIESCLLAEYLISTRSQ